jgi:hypothetical protein
MRSKTIKNIISTKRNIIAFCLAIISSFFLFLSGTTGVNHWMKIEEIITSYIAFQFINVIFIVILIVASLGGISVLIGGILLLKKKQLLGNLLITLGAGAGLIGFLFNILISILTLNFSISSYLSYSSIGIFFALFAKFLSTNIKKKWWYKGLRKLFRFKTP